MTTKGFITFSFHSMKIGPHFVRMVHVLSSTCSDHCETSLCAVTSSLRQQKRWKALSAYTLWTQRSSSFVTDGSSSSLLMAQRLSISHTAEPAVHDDILHSSARSSFCSSTSPASKTAGDDLSSDSSSSSFDSSQKKKEWKEFVYRPRWKYSAPFRSSSFTDYMYCKGKSHAVSIARTYRHREKSDLTVTLIPLRHLAHPIFFAQVDALCGQHESVLMEGRTPLTGAPYSTLVPSREPLPMNQRPIDHEDDEGWEPRAVEDFFQPFSWGVTNSPRHTVIHAADRYDYEYLPWYCSLRFNIPLLGSMEREKHCLNMILPLYENGYKSFAIPWGAGHMCIFHEMLLDNHFEQVGMCSLLMLNRIDGERSEAELLKLQSYEKKLSRRVTLAYVAGALMVLYILSTMFEVEFSGPSKRLPPNASFSDRL